MASRKKKPTDAENAVKAEKKDVTAESESAPKQKKTVKKTTKKKTEVQLVPVEGTRAVHAETTPKKEETMPVAVSGQRQVQTSAGVPISFPEEEKRNFLSRVALLLVLLAVVVASVLIFAFRPSEYTERTDSVNFFYRPEQNVTVIAVNGTVRGEVSGALTYKTYDGTGRVCAAILEGKLYVIKGRSVTEIDDAVTDCVLSSNGKFLAWRTDVGELYYSAVGKKDSTYRISGQCLDDRYCLSPSGKEMVYTYTGDDGVLRLDVYSGTGSKPYLSRNEELYPVAVADRCRYVYYTDANGALYVLNTKEDQRRLCGDKPDLDSLIFNRSNSEVLFYNEGQTRIFRKGENVILPDLGSTDILQLIPNQRVAYREQRVGVQLLQESFFDSYYVYYADSTVKLIFLERKKTQGVVTDVSFVDSAAAVTVTDKSVFFLQTSKGTATHTNLYRCKTGKTEVQDLQWDVQDFCANVDGSRILYVDVHGALYSLQIGAVPEILYDSIVVEEGVIVTKDDAFYFYREEGKLCVSDNGAAPRELRDGVQDIAADGHTLFYVTDIAEDGRYTVYSNYRNRRKDTQIAAGVGGMK